MWECNSHASDPEVYSAAIPAHTGLACWAFTVYLHSSKPDALCFGLHT